MFWPPHFSLPGTGRPAEALGPRLLRGCNTRTNCERMDRKIAIELALALGALYREEEATGVLRPFVIGAVSEGDAPWLMSLVRPYWAAMFTLERFEGMESVLDACDRVATATGHSGLRAVVASTRRATAAMCMDVERFDVAASVDGAQPIDGLRRRTPRGRRDRTQVVLRLARAQRRQRSERGGLRRRTRSDHRVRRCRAKRNPASLHRSAKGRDRVAA